MTTKSKIEVAFAPRWTWRVTILSAGVTLLLFFGLPSLEMLANPPEKTLDVRTIDTVDLPPPPPPILRAKPESEPDQAEPLTPKPQLQEVNRTLLPLKSQMNLMVAMGEVGGDFAVSGFGISGDELNEQMSKLVFELSELDEKPRPLNRLKPLYPQHAKMRKIEGFVVVDFVVGEDGTARSIEVFSEQPSSVFTQAAIDAIARWRFSPGTKSGKPVAARVRQKVQFNLK